MAQTERKEGYYWVKAKARKDTTEQRQHLDTWFIGYYKPNICVWTLSGFSQVFIEDDFIEINENRITQPDEELITLSEGIKWYKAFNPKND